MIQSLEQVIDAHVHLDDRLEMTAAGALDRLEAEMDDAGVGHAIVLHLLWQRWSIEEVAEALNSSARVTGFANVDPTASAALGNIQRAAEIGFQGLKLHPRIQRYLPDDPACVAAVRRAGELGFPVIIDCFPDGDWLMMGLSVLHYAELAKQAPQTTIVIAHAAGHHCLDLLMLAKRIPNLWFDVSYSLLYYGRSVVESLFYCMKSIRYERVMFGTDYPDRPLKVAVKSSLDLFDFFNVTGEARQKVLWKNAQQLLRKP